MLLRWSENFRLVISVFLNLSLVTSYPPSVFDFSISNSLLLLFPSLHPVKTTEQQQQKTTKKKQNKNKKTNKKQKNNQTKKKTLSIMSIFWQPTDGEDFLTEVSDDQKR